MEVPFLISPNQSSRKRNVDMIIIHATGGSFQGALDWMRNPASQASAHYLIDTDGKTVQLVQDSKKAWHAGRSTWKGESDLNQNSIGIELANADDGKDTYDAAQMAALEKLVLSLQEKFPKITDDRVLGHSQVAPGRKPDPGPLFPWPELRKVLDENRP